MAKENYITIIPQHCERCGQDYTPTIYSDECPHEKLRPVMPEQDKELQLKRDLNKILIDFGNAYETLPNELNNTTALKLSSILSTARDKIISVARPLILKQLIDLAIECGALHTEEQARINNCKCKPFWDKVHPRKK